MSLRAKLRRHGPLGFAMRAVGAVQKRGLQRWHRWRLRNAEQYQSPGPQELAQIEQGLQSLGIAMEDYAPDPAKFAAFKAQQYFPAHYHGGLHSGVWDEKLLEHWIAAERLGLLNLGGDSTYVDVAACRSPWAQALRERHGLQAWAVDLDEVGDEFADLPYYLQQNATAMQFADRSVDGVSLHCAYEMFAGNDDRELLAELARVLKPGAKAIIVPLYLHTHYCAYATPEYYGRGHSDSEAKEYVRLDTVGVPSSRKYDPARFKQRVWDRALELGLTPKLLALRNGAQLGDNIYCHFVLEFTR